ncbi:DUF89 domain-containing protein [Geopyxis carbonaria]|nr:DUF89 domain-containing protein [Geopyxis carbonaria]
MEHDPKTPQYKTSTKTSFAYISARDRWPVILTQAIDDVFRTTRDHTVPGAIAEGKDLVAQLAKLKYEVQHDRALSPLQDDGGSDIAAYNAELAALGDGVRWFDVPWLFSECYLYRRVRTFFALTAHWQTYDPFRAQKDNTFRSSLAAVLELAARYRTIVEAQHGEDEEKDRLLFLEIMEICLWGNATDLSLLTSLTYEDIQKLQGSEARKKAEANILVNDLPRVFETLRASPAGRVDIVLDNAGFELYVDLVLAGYLLAAGLATEVVLHPKDIPWFVSDVLPGDFGSLLTALQDPTSFFGPDSNLTDAQTADLTYVFTHWSSAHTDGKLVLRPNAFWTTADSYWRLPARAPSLHADLQASALVVFKGDLNYRKLTADAAWEPTTPFGAAIGPLGGEGSGVRVLALRTCKADVVVGLPEGRDEELRGGDGSGSRKWGWSGKWAVVQFWDGKRGGA